MCKIAVSTPCRYPFWLFVAFLPAIAGCLPQTSIEPVPPEFTTLARIALIRYADELAHSLDRTSAELKRNPATTAELAHSQLADATKTARQTAFAPIDEMLETELGGEKWNADRASVLFQQIGSAFRATGSTLRHHR